MTDEDGEQPGSGLSVVRKTQIALVLFTVIAALAWYTMEPGKLRTLVLIVLGGLALRLLLGTRLPARLR